MTVLVRDQCHHAGTRLSIRAGFSYTNFWGGVRGRDRADTGEYATEVAGAAFAARILEPLHKVGLTGRTCVA